MTTMLQQAFQAASMLPEAEQDVLASRLLAELASEDEFDAKIASTGEKLARLSREAIAEFHAGKTLPLDFSDE